MEAHAYEERPAKKRRFFADPDDEVATFSGASSPAAVPNADAAKAQHQRFFQDLDEDEEVTPETARHVDVSRSSATPLGNLTADDRPSSLHVEAGPSSNGTTSLAFDQDTFEAFVGEKVKPDVLEIIRDHCGDNIETAVNMYYDGTYKNLKKKVRFPALQPSIASQPKPQQQKPSDANAIAPGLLHSMPESRYIGAFGVEGWATRSGANLLRHGDVVKIERSKIIPPKKGKGSLAAQKRVDVIVRFTDTRGTELGRLAKDTANWVSSLIDQKVCKFEGTCVYAPDRLRTNDTLFLQLRCSLLKSVFQRGAFTMADNRSTGLFEEKETSAERDLRLRQVAMVRLFQEINLNPSKLNAAAARHQRQDLLDAAELAEKKEKETPKQKKTDVSGSSTPSEDEDGEELQQDQLDSLYKKAQSFDFDTPEAEPPDTCEYSAFPSHLRPKRLLVWVPICSEKTTGLLAASHPCTPHSPNSRERILTCCSRHDSSSLPETGPSLDVVQREK